MSRRERYKEGVPSVTELLKWAGYYAEFPNEPTGYYLRRGNFVDQCCAILAQGQRCDERTTEAGLRKRIKPLVRGNDSTERWADYIAAFVSWLSRRPCEFIAAQQYVFNPWETYQGTYDLKLRLDVTKLVRVDIKTGDGACTRATALQLAGYDMADERTARLGLELHADQTFTEYWYKDNKDYDAFRLLARWYHKHKDYK